MTARILNLNDDERFTRRPFGSVEESPFESLSSESELAGQEGFSGAISLPLLPDLIQIYTTSMANGALTIRHHGEVGTIWFDHGAMVHAVCGENVGEEAVYRLLQWNDGRFSLDTQAQAPMHSITSSWQKVLMEGCRLLDEERSEVPAVFPDARPPAELDAVLQDIEDALGGLLAVSIFDATDGSVIAQRSRSIDLSPAGPAVAQLVQAHGGITNAMAQSPELFDCFSNFGDQVHLLAPLGDRRLLYLAANREGVNLALIRRVIERAFQRLP